MADATTYETILWDSPRDAVRRVTLNRPEQANAQNRQMLYELNAALDAAVADPACRVIVVAAAGKHFSSGHDLRDRSKMTDFDQVTVMGGFEQPGEAGPMAVEEEIYLGLCWRWRNLPKPTIVAVQGKVIAGGCMLVWPFDLVVCADDASFSDPVVAFGVNGVEYFAHAYELGPRKAKEMLFTGEALSAEECRALGMVNHVVPRDELESFTLDLASRIAERPAFGLKLAKMSVNQSQEAQGFYNALQAAFSLQHVGHAHNQIVHGMMADPSGAEIIRNLGRKG
ncbi:MAG: enoyl-CoA hydratase [Acidimicrobiia bacterium]|nr:enoyl-CoA hydratase [Acidimicrobiia bacterium]